jgi:transposase InsO family protein
MRSSEDSSAELAKRYNVSIATARKWKGRDDSQDRSHRPHILATTLSVGQELLVVELRRMLLLPLDDLLAVTREFINPDVSRSGLDRCLRRHEVSNLKGLQPEIEGEIKPLKTFKDCAPGFLHMDIKYLPQMPDETHRRSLFVAIDRATRWVYLRSYRNQSEQSSVDFLRRLQRAAPMNIKNILTDNGSQFTDRFTSKTRTPSGRHMFDVACSSMGIEHRLCPPRHPQTNGMVERFNGRISDLVKQTRFASAGVLDATLTQYLTTYNHHIPQRALNHKSPIQALKRWQIDNPDLFVKRVYKHAGLDKYRITNDADIPQRVFSRQLPIHRLVAHLGGGAAEDQVDRGLRPVVADVRAICPRLLHTIRRDGRPQV